MKKVSLFIFVFLALIFAAGIFWFALVKSRPVVSDQQPVSSSEPSPAAPESDSSPVVSETVNEAAAFLDQLTRSSQIEFSPVAAEEFDWRVPVATASGSPGSVAEVVVSGLTIRAVAIPARLEDEIHVFLKDSGFTGDAFNTATGTMSIDGYRRGQLVCLLSGGLALAESSPSAESLFDLQISCGLLPDDPSGSSAIENQVLLAFAEKYGRPSAQISLKVNQFSENFASGVVNFADEISGAYWLAYKPAGQNWQLVFDGNGTIPCGAVDPYGFPAEMVPECWDESLQSLKTRLD